MALLENVFLQTQATDPALGSMHPFYTGGSDKIGRSPLLWPMPGLAIICLDPHAAITVISMPMQHACMRPSISAALDNNSHCTLRTFRKSLEPDRVPELVALVIRQRVVLTHGLCDRCQAQVEDEGRKQAQHERARHAEPDRHLRAKTGSLGAHTYQVYKTSS